MKQILISYVCSTYKSKSKEFLVDKTLSRVCSKDEEKSKVIIVDESSTEESESECVHKNINNEKYANNEAEYLEPSVTYDPVVKEPSYFNIFEYR